MPIRKHILLLFILTLFYLGLKGQILTQTYVDPCDGKIYTVTFPITDIGTLVIIRNEAKVFTSQDFRNGTVTTWIRGIFSKPCAAVQQTVQQTITQSVTQTVSSTTSSLTSATASMSSAATTAAAPAPTPTTSSTTTQSGDGGNVSTTDNNSSSSETKSESSSSSESKSEDSKSESKSESKKEEKKSEEKKKEEKKEAMKNPVMMASDLTVAEGLGNRFTTILAMGMTKSSLAGDATYGGNVMIWSNLKQFVIGGSYSKTKYKGGKPKSINSYNASAVYLNGNWVQLTAWTHIIPTKTKGTFGWNISAVNIFLVNQNRYNQVWDDKKGWLNLFLKKKGYDYNGVLSAVGFWMKAYPVNPKLVISPQAFLILSPYGYNSVLKESNITINNNTNLLIGSSFDYKLSKRFGISFNYKVASTIQSNPTILHNFLIGSRMLL